MRRQTKKYISVFAFLFSVMLFSAHAFAQDPQHDEVAAPAKTETYMPFSLEAGGELWYPLTDFALKDNFGGVYSLHASLQHVIFKRLYGGLEIQSNEISQLSPEAIQIAISKANLFFYNIGAKLSYYSFQAHQWLFAFSFTAGQSWLVFTDVQNVPKPSGGFKKQAFFYAPRLCESIMVNNRMRIGVEFTYTVYNYTFDPSYLGIVKTYTPQQASGLTGMIGWGFGITYFLGTARP